MADRQKWWKPSFSNELDADEREDLQICAELWLQHELVDDRDPPLTRVDDAELTSEQNDRRSDDKLERLYNHNFKELCYYWRGQDTLIDYVFYGEQSPRQLLRNYMTRFDFFKECLYRLRRSLKKLLRYNLIAEMPKRETISTATYRIDWIRYTTGKNLLKNSLRTSVKKMLKEMWPWPARPSTATIRWPGDQEVVYEPASSLQDVFGKKIKKHNFKQKLIECADFPFVDKGTFDGQPLAIHHIISKALLFSLMEKLSEHGRRSVKCAQIDHRFDNIVDHNYRKYYMVQLWKNRTGENPREYVKNGPPDNFPTDAQIFYTDYYRDICGRSIIWREGNLFAGPLPELRGPFDPNTWDESKSFETDAEPILGAVRFAELRILHDCMRDFVELPRPTREQADQIRDHWLDVFWRYHLVLPNENQWIKRQATLRELRRLDPTCTPLKFVQEEYWAIRSEAEII